MCYADFCDVFRCTGYLKSHKKRRKLKRDKAFTKILGNHETLYDLGININDGIADSAEFSAENDADTAENKNALVKAPPKRILWALDEKKGKNREDKFVVGVESDQEALGNLNSYFGADY